MLKIDGFKKLLIIIIFALGIIVFIGGNVSYYEKTNCENSLKLIERNGIVNQGCSIINGKVLNTSNFEVSQIEVVVTLFNSSQKEIAKTKEVYDVNLSPNDTYKFTISCMKKDSASYDIQVSGKLKETIESKSYWDIFGYKFYE
ncbi:MAG: FxLYD domain-containing protein [Oscillospiraceae bacterium]